MFDQSADPPASDQAPAPIGMRELPAQPPKPVMPAYAAPSGADPMSAQEHLAQDQASVDLDDSVVARDDHFEGTFTSRGTVRVLGSVKGRIEAVRVRIEDGARVEADVIVDEAIVAGVFTGNLTCRQRLEAHASGRISGRVETHKLMLHEGASVEGEMHMITEEPRDARETIRGSAPVRGETGSKSAAPTVAPTTEAIAPTARSSASRSTPPKAAADATSAADPAEVKPAPRVEAAAPRRSPVAETLRAETLRLTPRSSTPAPSASANGARQRSGTTTGF